MIEDVQQIDIGQVLAAKFGRRLPQAAVRLLEKLIHQREINDILHKYRHYTGSEFMHRLIEEFEVSISLMQPENLPTDGRAVFVSNHPLGGLDGICLSHLLSKQYGDVRYIVNDILYYLRPLQSIFLPVNTLGHQQRTNILRLNEALGGDLPVVTFPAGYCSRLINGRIQDTDWSKSFVRMAIDHHRDVVPIFFDGFNTSRFYKIESWRKRLGIKFDIGTTLLPNEMFRARGKSFAAVIGQPIRWQTLTNDTRDVRQIATEIRDKVYRIGDTCRMSK